MIYPHFHKMRSIGLHAATCLGDLISIIKPGVSAAEVENYVKAYADTHGLGCPQYLYENDRLSDAPFPGRCCVSLNEEHVHGIPSANKIFEPGDIVKVDVTFTDPENWHGDSCMTYVVGGQYEEVVNCAFMALNEGIKAVKVGEPISVIGTAIDNYVRSKHYSVLRDFCGHSIGQQFHLPPVIPHYYYPEHPDSAVILKPGMMFTIEPTVCEGDDTYFLQEDNKWTIEAADGGWSAQFEHTLGIDEDGKVIIFTLP